MLIQKAILEDIFEIIKKEHQLEPWKALSRCIDREQLFESPMSEYELYFNFCFSRTLQAKIRRLKWKNIIFNIQQIDQLKKAGYHYVTCHSWMRKIRYMKISAIFLLLTYLFFSNFVRGYSIVFVHLRPKLPPYIFDAINQARMFNPKCNIYLIANRRAWTNAII